MGAWGGLWGRCWWRQANCLGFVLGWCRVQGRSSSGGSRRYRTGTGSRARGRRKPGRVRCAGPGCCVRNSSQQQQRRLGSRKDTAAAAAPAAANNSSSRHCRIYSISIKQRCRVLQQARQQCHHQTGRRGPWACCTTTNPALVCISVALAGGLCWAWRGWCWWGGPGVCVDPPRHLLGLPGPSCHSRAPWVGSGLRDTAGHTGAARSAPTAAASGRSRASAADWQRWQLHPFRATRRACTCCSGVASLSSFRLSWSCLLRPLARCCWLVPECTHMFDCYAVNLGVGLAGRVLARWRASSSGDSAAVTVCSTESVESMP